MERVKIVYLEEYRKARQYKNLLEMIEGHLAEANLIGEYSYLRCNSSHGEIKHWRLFDADGNGE